MPPCKACVVPVASMLACIMFLEQHVPLSVCR
jgi:hypothetical protein